MLSTDPLAITASTFALISVAELGDKSQIVCMTLAARHRHWPVLWGAAVAFVALNLVAVVFGAAVAHWIPDTVTALVVAALFAAFGIHALLTAAEPDCDEAPAVTGRSLFLTALVFIFVAEFGDKTQLAVAGLAGQFDPWPVWLGATVALIAVSAIGIWAGTTLLRRMDRRTLHRASGWLFLVFAALAAWQGLAA
jgi:putative Ca2+/H+ antiporter (TMEM165/GDT1 family)